MTTPSEAYLSSLSAGETKSALEAREPLIEREEGPLALARCLEGRLAHEAAGGAEATLLRSLALRTGAALERAAYEGEGEGALQLCVQAYARFGEAEDEVGQARAAAHAVERCLAERRALGPVLEALGGAEAAQRALRRRLKAKEVKQDPTRSAGVRRALARLAEERGDTDGAFFETLGAVRKAPQEPLYIDEAFRLALSTERYDEVRAVFRELAEDPALPARQRATVYRKLGHIAERGHKDLPGALLAYTASVKLHPRGKGALRHKERLEALLAEKGGLPLLVEHAHSAPSLASLTSSSPALPHEAGQDGVSAEDVFADVGTPAPPVPDATATATAVAVFGSELDTAFEQEDASAARPPLAKTAVAPVELGSDDETREAPAPPAAPASKRKTRRKRKKARSPGEAPRAGQAPPAAAPAVDRARGRLGHQAEAEVLVEVALVAAPDDVPGLLARAGLAVDPADEESVAALLALIRMRLTGEPDTERPLEAPQSAQLKEASTDRGCLEALAKVLAGLDTPEARLRALETLLLHHAPALDEDRLVALWGELGQLRWRLGEGEAAREALGKALDLAAGATLRAALSGEAVSAAVHALIDDPESEAPLQLRVAVLRLSAERAAGEARASWLLRAARLAREEGAESTLCRGLFAEAIEAYPDGREAHEALLETEGDPLAKAGHHLRLARLLARTAGSDEDVAQHLKSALRLAPARKDTQAAAEAHFAATEDAGGLAALYAAQLSALEPRNIRGRVALLERLAQVRRYDLRDLEGAAEALEAASALDPEAIKPREDCARVYTELGRWREAAAAWRAVLERDPLAAEAWRGLFLLYARTGQGDEAFAIAAAMATVDLADEETVRAVRRVRPPFPRWPRARKDADALRRNLGHVLEKTPVRLVTELVGREVHAALARPLKDFGLRKKHRLLERQVPPSVLLAVRAVKELVGLDALPPLYCAELGSALGKGPPFALLPLAEPSLVVSEEVLKGGMTPERAFALGRAMAWLTPHALLASTLDASALKEALDALALRFVPGVHGEGEHSRLLALGARLEAEVMRGVAGPAAERRRDAVRSALRDYVHAREKLSLSDWIAGVGYTADRLGFLLIGDLVPAARVIRGAASESQLLGARLAIKELVLFSASAAYLQLRKELGVALPDGDVRAVLELG